MADTDRRPPPDGGHLPTGLPALPPPGDGLFRVEQVAVPVSIGILVGIAMFFGLQHLLTDEGDLGIQRYLGNPFNQLIVSLFVATMLYALLQWCGLAIDRRALADLRGEEPHSAHHRILRTLSGRDTGQVEGFRTTVRHWHGLARRSEDVLVLSDHLLMVRERQYALDLSPVQYAVWAMPLLGFVGTVVGITQAIAGLGLTVENPGGSAAGLETVLAGLRFAFDTTFMGLVLVLPTMAVLMPLRARGEAVAMMFHEALLNDFFLRRPRPEADA